MTQGTASFKYEVEKNSTGVTGLAGLPMYDANVKSKGRVSRLDG